MIWTFVQSLSTGCIVMKFTIYTHFIIIFEVFSSFPPTEEDPVTCTMSEAVVVLLFFGASLLIINFSNDRFVSSDRPLCIISAYLLCCFGCTDPFKEALDYADSILSQLSFDSDVLILGDLNADPGSEGGPMITTNASEQGRILLRHCRSSLLLLHPPVL